LPNPHLAALYRSRGHWRGEGLWPTFAASVSRSAERQALVDGGVRLSAGDVEGRVAALAGGLAALGIGRGTVVSVQLPNWWETVVVYWALIRLGAVMNPLLPIHRDHELEFMMRESEAEALVVPGEFRGYDHRALAERMRAKLPKLGHVIVARAETGPGQHALDRLTASAAPREPARLDGDEPLLVMYTSGTTAEPKGVVHTHDTLHYELRSLGDVHGLGESDTVLMPSPLTHVSGLVHGALLPFVLGTRAVLMDSWDPRLALETIEREGVTYMVGAPIFLSDLAYHPDLAAHPTRTLRLFSCGGAGVSPDLIRESRRRLGCVAKRVYGSTELPTLTTTSAEDAAERGATTEGRPIGAAELRIVDDEGRDVRPGVPGEILARGPDCFVGYQNRALDREAFTEDGWFRTGDLGVVDEDGYLTVTGRKKDIVIRKGEKISAAELEAAIERHPAVAAAAVIALPDSLSGERACACVTLREGAALELADLARFLIANGLSRQKVPEALELLDALPRTASGKVQKHVLRETIERRRR
jgi:non-ribosomal peptide synthetase component E (peptide arylation enzyme)